MYNFNNRTNWRSSMLLLKRKNNSLSYIVRSLKNDNLIPLLRWLSTYETTFYKMGWAYFQNQSDIEQTLLKTTIQASENVNHLVNSSLFENWFIDIFLDISETDRNVGQRKDHRLEMKELLSVLDKNTRKIIVLTVYGNYTFIQVAKILEIPETKVKSSIYKGLKYIHTCY